MWNRGSVDSAFHEVCYTVCDTVVEKDGYHAPWIKHVFHFNPPVGSWVKNGKN